MKKIGTVDRFLEKVKQLPNGCWFWTAFKCRQGYGFIKVNYKSVRAHRFSYENFVGQIPVGMDILHRCDNSSCVNPEHLYPGDDKQNAYDRDSRGRSGAKLRRGEKNGRTKVSDAQVVDIRRSHLSRTLLSKKYGISLTHVYRILGGEYR